VSGLARKIEPVFLQRWLRPKDVTTQSIEKYQLDFRQLVRDTALLEDFLKRLLKRVLDTGLPSFAEDCRDYHFSASSLILLPSP
jgi:hypothetical protein